MLFSQTAHTSPFDVTEVEDETIEEKQEQSIREENPVKQIEAFDSVMSGRLIILDRKIGKKSVINVKKNEIVKLKNINFKLEECHVEKEKFFQRISIGKVTIDNKSILLNSSSLTVIDDQYLAFIHCE